MTNNKPAYRVTHLPVREVSSTQSTDQRRLFILLFTDIYKFMYMYEAERINLPIV